jgi:hypothetical protein
MNVECVSSIVKVTRRERRSDKRDDGDFESVIPSSVKRAVVRGQSVSTVGQTEIKMRNAECRMRTIADAKKLSPSICPPASTNHNRREWSWDVLLCYDIKGDLRSILSYSNLIIIRWPV